MSEYNIGIAITDPNDWTAQAIVHEIMQQGMEPVPFDPTEIVSSIDTDLTIISDDCDLLALDAVIVRDMGQGGPEAQSFRLNVLEILNEQVPVINSTQAIICCANKFYSYHCFKKAGIRVPETHVVQTMPQACRVMDELGDCVIKPMFGYKGMGVMRIDAGSMDDDNGDGVVMREVESALHKRGALYIQEFIPATFDVRIFVVAGVVVGAIKRTAPEGGWVNNLSQGGTPSVYEPTEEDIEMALKASEAVGADYAGVDILDDYLLEINGTPSGKGIMDVCGKNVASDIVRHVKEEITG
ncbi:MAG: RimK family alpha-L-glutamate ligase [Methanosarcinales archaeon]|nr:RimK family alpha-L-glutamate ligase [Methanosarcinales archaeon]